MQERGDVNPTGGLANATVQTVSFCDMLILSGDDFDEVLCNHLRANPSTTDHTHTAHEANTRANPTAAVKKHSVTILNHLKVAPLLRETLGGSTPSPEGGGRSTCKGGTDAPTRKASAAVVRKGLQELLDQRSHEPLAAPPEVKSSAGHLDA